MTDILNDAYDGFKPKNQSKEVQQALKAQMVREFWKRGCLRYKCRPGGQAELYDKIHAQPKTKEGLKPVVALCHRRFGKSYLSSTLGIERCIAQPGAEVYFCTDTKRHSRKILEESLYSIFGDMPDFISYRTREKFYFFRMKHWPKGQESMLVLEGLNHNMGADMRGGKADLVIIDEARDVKNLEYVVTSVIGPMFKGRPNPTLVMCSTPPESLDHDFVTVYYENARNTDSLVVIPASKNPDWTEIDTKLMLDQFKTKESMGWRREIECEMIPDTTRVIIPEWEKARKTCVIEPVAKRPAFYPAYVSIDAGWKDHTGALFAYYDFNQDKIIIVDEIFVNYIPTEDFAEILVDKLKKHFPANDHLRIISESNALNLADLNRAIQKLGDYHVSEADKFDRDASINNLRSGIQAGKVLVQKNCEETINQFMNGTWNIKKTGFDRSPRMGHCDLISAAYYLYKKVVWGENLSSAPSRTWQEGIQHNPFAPAHVEEKKAVVTKIFGGGRFQQRRRKFR
jgi:hypothetical protein